MDSFYALFSSYWWLLFPLGFFVAAGFSSYMRYKRTQAKIDLLDLRGLRSGASRRVDSGPGCAGGGQ